VTPHDDETTASRARRGRLPTVGAVHDWDAGDRHASWLELFFDLVVVVAVANLGEVLHHDPSPGGAATFVGLLIPVWWAWISYSYFADLFDDDSPPHRLAQLAGMLGMIVLAVTLTGGVDRDGHLFALAYGALFLLLTAMYARVGATEPRAAELCRWYTAGSALGAGLWLVSAAVPAPGRYVLWAVALVANASISGPVAYARMRSQPAQVSHMPERFGLFTIVVLGETVLSVVGGIGATDWRAASTVTAVAGFVIGAGIWWVYFGGFDEEAISRAIAGGRSAQVRSFVYGYGHLVIYAAIVAVGVGVEIAIEHAAEGTEAPAMLGWAVAALIAGFVLISIGPRWTTVPAILAAKAGLAVGAVVACAVGLPAAVATSIVAAGWALLVATEVHLGVPERAGPS
jgi:low temperature requirement protein LtrA